jgi:hypothetical protein
MDEKINDSGFIPDLKVMSYKGVIVYFRNTNQVMGIFKGLGISQSLLEKNTKYDSILFHFEAKRPEDRKYDGWYLAKMEQFRTSKKKHANGYDDVQRFVSFADMEKVE